MLKRTMLLGAIALAVTAGTAAEADAGIIRRVAPVRRVAARAVLPPYPVARRAVVGPVVRRPYAYRAPVVYGPRVYVGFGW